jgi:hypothetical protein
MNPGISQSSSRGSKGPAPTGCGLSPCRVGSRMLLHYQLVPAQMLNFQVSRRHGNNMQSFAAAAAASTAHRLHLISADSEMLLTRRSHAASPSTPLGGGARSSGLLDLLLLVLSWRQHIHVDTCSSTLFTVFQQRFWAVGHNGLRFLSHFHTARMDEVAHTASAPTAAEAMNNYAAYLLF